MAYREDVDLEFLSKVSSQDLDSIVSLLTHDPEDGRERRTEELTKYEKYKRHYPDHHQYWDLIAAEIQCFGANTVVTIFRGGKGVLYREILMDVCDNQSVNYNKKSDTRHIEAQLIGKILEKQLSEMTRDELRRLARGLKVSPGYFEAGATAGIAGLLSGSGTLVGTRVASMATAAFIPSSTAIAVGGLGTFLAGRFLMGAFLPASIAATALQVAGPAYRVTLPACVHIAALRREYELSPADILKMKKEEELCERFAEQIRAYRSSDKKMMGLYIMAKALPLASFGLAVEDIEADLFGLDSNSLERVKALMDNEKSWQSFSFEDSVRYAVKSCSCDKNALKVSLQLIMEYSVCDIQDVSRLFQRFDDIVQQI